MRTPACQSAIALEVPEQNRTKPREVPSTGADNLLHARSDHTYTTLTHQPLINTAFATTTLTTSITLRAEDATGTARAAENLP